MSVHYVDNDPAATIDEWIMYLLFLREEFGPGVRLYTEAGYSNVELVVEEYEP